MIEELKELVRELKNPALAIGLGAMIVMLILLANITFSK